MTYNTIARPPDATRDRAESTWIAINRDPRPYDGVRWTSNTEKRIPRRHTPTRHVRHREDHLVRHRRRRARAALDARATRTVRAATSRSTARDATRRAIARERRAAREGRIAIVSRATRDDDATRDDARRERTMGVRGARDALQDARARRARDAARAATRVRGGAETRARGAIGTDSERGARASARDEGLTARAVVRERCSAMKTNAKYGDESVYFDLSDVEATTGSWDVYGVDASSRYPDQQAAFFEYAAQGLGRREAVYSLLAVSAGLLTVGYGVKGAKDAKLPITVGPQQPAVVGPRDRI